MYVQLEEFILVDLHVLLYTWRMRYWMEFTLIFIQSQQWMRNVRNALNT